MGGELLDKLQEALLEQGDEKLRILHENIVKAAAEPFLKTLSRWLFKGELIDPYYEFFIQENVTMTREALQEDFNAHYWEGRYTLRRRHTPKILRNHAEKALTAGKYLNVIRDCLTGITVHDTYDGDETLPVDESVFAAIPERELTFDIDGTTQLVGAIEFAYQNSSNNLLKLLEEKYNLSSHIRSLRRFFLLEHGDFFLQFMDTANEELSREAKDVAIGRVQSLLQLALHTSTLSLDPHKENLTCVLASHNLIQHLHLIQAAGEGEVHKV